jgi:hypothetical protein
MNPMKHSTFPILGILALTFYQSLEFSRATGFDVAQYNVVWDSSSTNATGSMPLAGGNLGLNVWVEGDDLLFYLGSPDSRVEDEKLVKLGRVRLSFSSAPFRNNFRQELDLAESCLHITGDGLKIRLWMDAFAPVVHVEMESAAPVTATVAYESWRFAAESVTNGLEWHYRLDPAKTDRAGRMVKQRVTSLASLVPDPLGNLTLGGRIVAPGLVADGTGSGTYMGTAFKFWKLKTKKPVTSLDLRVLTRVAQDASMEVWRSGLDKLASAPDNRAKTVKWWRAFWERSWININPGTSASDLGWQVGRNYQLFRYILAANRTGRAPTLFNGGFFTFDNPLPNATAYDAAGPCPDERAWWGCLFMAQNQRWLYWPLLRSGDLDLLDVGLDFYRNRAPMEAARVKLLMGVEGTEFDESLDIYGLTGTGQSGDGHNANAHLRNHYTSMLDFAYLMAEECRFTGCDPAPSLPVMLGALKFFDSYYQKETQQRTGQPLDAQGQLVIFPCNACEQGEGCKNNSDAIGGLRAIARGLLELKISAADRAWVEGFAKRLPAIYTAEKNGHRIIPLAESWQHVFNPNEFPQVYNFFPFHNYGVGLPDLELARDTWRFGAINDRLAKESVCWKYGNTAVAELGLADEAKAYALKKFLYPYGADGQNMSTLGNCAQFQPRFPAFWATYPFDAFPDMDHGGCAMVGLQEMLLQTPGDKLLLLPAWPPAWDVSFKMHAPQSTTVECEVRGGKIVRLEVTPAARRKDVEIVGPVAPLPPVPVPMSVLVAGSGTNAVASSSAHPSARSLSALDLDHDGRISLDEFYLTGPPPLHPRMKQVFESFDPDHQGSLSYADTRRAIATVSGLMPKLTPEVDGALRPITIEVNPRTKRALIKATVNGVEGRFLLDTGTSDTILNPAFAKKAGVDFVEICTMIVAGNYGKKGDTVSLVRVPDMEIAGTHFRDFHAVLRKSEHRYEFGGDGELDGVMGANVLFRKPLTLDFRRQTLVFATNNAGAHDFTFDLIPNHRNTPAVQAEIDGTKIELMFDSGTAIDDAVLVNEPYHAALRKLADEPAAKTYHAREVRVGGQLLAANQLCLLQPFEQTVLGSLFYDRHVITVDQAAGKIWLDRNR